MDRFSEDNNCINMDSKILKKYDHRDLYRKGHTLTSMIYKKTSTETTEVVGTFPDHVDQIYDISYEDNDINDTIDIMKKVCRL